MKRILHCSLIAAGVALTLAGGSMTARAEGTPQSATEVHPLMIGAKAPEVTLRTMDGAAFDLAAAIKKGPTVVIFYRGGW